MFKKIILLFGLLVFLTTTIFAPVAQAASGTWYNQGVIEWWKKVDGSPENEIFGERYTAAQVQWVFYGTLYFLISLPTQGISVAQDAVSCFLRFGDFTECVTSINSFYNELSSADQNSNLADQISKRPLSFVSYVKGVANKLNPVQEVSAQGFGFETNNALLELWRLSRDTAFALLVIAIVVLSFLIMFRVKINPQTVISAQSAIPRVAIVLVLITFSYAIAGLMVDLMYVIIGLIALIFSNLSTLGPIDLFRQLNSWGIFRLMLLYWVEFIAATVVSIASSTFITSFFMSFAALVAVIPLFFFFIKITIMLLKNFAMIVLLIIVAPLQILTGVITPGAGFGPWLRSITSKLMVYPLLSVLFMLSFLFLWAGFPSEVLNIEFPTPPPFYFTAGALRGAAWEPPLTFGTGGGQGPILLWIVASYSIIALTPKVVEIIQAVMERKPFPYGTAIGESLSPVTGALKMARGSAPVRALEGAMGTRGAEKMLNSKIGNAVSDFLVDRGVIDPKTPKKILDDLNRKVM